MYQFLDTALVEQAKAGNQQAFAELYSRWFDPVYDFVARMTRNRDEAEDIAQDTFLKAMNALGGLQKGASFKSWIFTIARNTALNRIEKAGRTRPLVFQDSEGAEVSMDVVDTDRFGSPEEAAEAKASAALVWEAAAGLDPKQLSLLDLHLRQGLDSTEIADVLCVTKNNGYVMLNRLKKAVEDAIGAFIMFKDGGRYCEDLDGLLLEANIGGMSPDVRKLVDRHVAQCDTCEEKRKKLIAPLAVFGAFAAIGTPPGVKAQILDGLMKEWPGPAAGGGGSPPSDGDAIGPPPGDGDGGPFLKKRGRAAAMMGAAAVLFLFGLFLFPVLGSGDGDDTGANGDGDGGGGVLGGGVNTTTPTKTSVTGQGNVSPTFPASPSATATAPAGQPTATPAITSGPGAPTPTTTSTPTPTATATPTQTATPTPTVIPTPTPPPCSAALSTNVGTLNIAPGGSSSFLLLASCNSTSYAISGGNGWANAVPADGTVSFGAGKTIAVSVDASELGEGSHSTTLLIQGEHNSTSVTVNTNVGGASPVILSFGVTCTSTQATFTAVATDDVAVSSVSVEYTLAPTNQPGSATLQQAGDTWSVTINLPTGAVAYRVGPATATATDGIGNVGFASDGNGCG